MVAGVYIISSSRSLSIAGNCTACDTVDVSSVMVCIIVTMMCVSLSS